MRQDEIEKIERERAQKTIDDICDHPAELIDCYCDGSHFEYTVNCHKHDMSKLMPHLVAMPYGRGHKILTDHHDRVVVKFYSTL